MIKSVIATIISILSLGLSVSAQDTDALLWQISGNNLSQPSYLFGTIHLMCPDDIQITQPMKDALRNSEQVVLELDMDEPGIMQEMQRVAMMTDGTTLNDLLNQDEYQLVENYLQDSLGVPMQAINTMKPLMLSTFTFLDVLNCQPGSYEMQLVQQAQEQQKEVLGLETTDDQAKAFDFIPLEEQADYLVDAIQNYDETVFEIEALLAAYQSEQVEHLYNITHESMQEMKGAEESLLTKRNQEWIPIMKEMAQDQPTFFAVGAAHLGGPMGVISLLKKQGYTVEPVRSVSQ